jgi:hypothetical protein
MARAIQPHRACQGPPAGHHQAQRGGISVFNPAAADDFSLIDNGDAVGERDELIEVFGDEQDGATALALFKK